jgi:hypothetical protein
LLICLHHASPPKVILPSALAACHAAKGRARLRRRFAVPTVGLWQMRFIPPTCRSRLISRNQLARTIDVMLQANPALAPPLSLRKPERTFLVLLTPALTRPGRAGDAISKSRLYGWLMPAYQDPDNSLLRQHLSHRDGSELARAARRLGRASWEDYNAVAPGACSWLTADSGTG